MNPVPSHIPSSLLFVDGLQINMDELQHPLWAKYISKGKMNELTFKTVNYKTIKFHVSQTFIENTCSRDSVSLEEFVVQSFSHV